MIQKDGRIETLAILFYVHTKMEQAVHIAMMEPYNISADWNMGSPTSERLPTRQGKVGRE